jgi:hypothetical protein
VKVLFEVACVPLARTQELGLAVWGQDAEVGTRHRSDLEVVTVVHASSPSITGASDITKFEADDRLIVVFAVLETTAEQVAQGG